MNWNTWVGDPSLAVHYPFTMAVIVSIVALGKEEPAVNVAFEVEVAAVVE